MTQPRIEKIEVIPATEVPPIIHSDAKWVYDLLKKLKELPPDKVLRLTTASHKEAQHLQVRLMYHKNKRNRHVYIWDIPLKNYHIKVRRNEVFLIRKEEE